MKTETQQFIRFAVVGVLNTAIDFAVFNLLIVAFGLGNGSINFIVFKSISFLAAVTNSFLFNKIWVFEDKDNAGNRLSRQAANFLVISLLGLLVNTAVSYVMLRIGMTYIHAVPLHNMANGAAVIGTFAVFMCNFFGYKFFVFRQKKKIEVAEIAPMQQRKTRAIDTKIPARDFTVRHLRPQKS